MTRRLVLDAWAVLALLQGEEPAASHVRQHLSDAQDRDAEIFISIINLGEVLYRIGRVKGENEAWPTLKQIRRLPLTVVPAEDGAIFAAVELKMHHPMSYADAFAAATADELDTVLVTGDPELERLESQIEIKKLERMER